jgi:hypothetical protein
MQHVLSYLTNANQGKCNHKQYFDSPLTLVRSLTRQPSTDTPIPHTDGSDQRCEQCHEAN